MKHEKSGLVRFGDGVAALIMSVVALILLAGVGVNFVNILARYFFLTPFHWVEEVMTFMLIWITFLSAGAIAWDGKHLSIDLFLPALPGVIRTVVVLGGLIATIAICALMFKQSWTMVTNFLGNDQTSLVAQIQMEIPHGAIPIGFALTIFLIGLRILSHRSSLSEVGMDDVLDDLELSNVVKHKDAPAKNSKVTD